MSVQITLNFKYPYHYNWWGSDLCFHDITDWMTSDIMSWSANMNWLSCIYLRTLSWTYRLKSYDRPAPPCSDISMPCAPSRSSSNNPQWKTVLSVDVPLETPLNVINYSVNESLAYINCKTVGHTVSFELTAKWNGTHELWSVLHACVPTEVMQY
jgi:hypothetical protein